MLSLVGYEVLYYGHEVLYYGEPHMVMRFYVIGSLDYGYEVLYYAGTYYVTML